MASGTPVVATPNLGALEVTQNGRSGLMANDAALAETLIKVLTEAELRERLRAEGLRRAQDFGWDKVCAQYEALYAGKQ
jgi:glycosyltransferase involved in cell wall biosynthesis